ncbi:MAG: hypothetical protein SPG52_08785 [Candidatus Cryptobacteroides sp.]|nr:hypothetical protein [Candidatus Cryptobacteroides sp.]
MRSFYEEWSPVINSQPMADENKTLTEVSDSELDEQMMPMLLLADLVAYPIACHILRPDVSNPAFDIIRKNIYLSEGKELGLKVIK